MVSKESNPLFPSSFSDNGGHTEWIKLWGVKKTNHTFTIHSLSLSLPHIIHTYIHYVHTHYTQIHTSIAYIIHTLDTHYIYMHVLNTYIH